MSEIEVKIVRLEPMRCASVLGYGREPENEAHRKLAEYAMPRGFFDDLAHHRVFGFNNPEPSPATPNYGYELWIEVGPDEEPEGDLRIVGFDGGLYAVTRVGPMSVPGEEIGKGWQALHAWVEQSAYSSGVHRWLEGHPQLPTSSEVEWSLDLYYPIAE